MGRLTDLPAELIDKIYEILLQEDTVRTCLSLRSVHRHLYRVYRCDRIFLQATRHNQPRIVERMLRRYTGEFSFSGRILVDPGIENQKAVRICCEFGWSEILEILLNYAEGK